MLLVDGLEQGFVVKDAVGVDAGDMRAALTGYSSWDGPPQVLMRWLGTTLPDAIDIDMGICS